MDFSSSKISAVFWEATYLSLSSNVNNIYNVINIDVDNAHSNFGIHFCKCLEHREVVVKSSD